jgi:hypothetical protein
MAWLSILITVAAQLAAPTDASGLLAPDEPQRAMVAASDAAGLERPAHPNLRINAPGSRVLSREQFFRNVRHGEVAAEDFVRVAKDVQITGTTAVVMGRETFTPSPASELGRTFGAKPLRRRYNQHLCVGGRRMTMTRATRERGS